jgi:ribose-phosphate pyrophosphokinase
VADVAEIKLFSGNSNLKLAQEVASLLDTPLSKAHVGRFSDGEINVEIHENVRGRDTYIIQSTSAPTNDHLMELVIMADALRRASAISITAVVPYFGYARQDRRVRSARVAITAKVVADMMASVGISRVITVDLHADQIQGFFYTPVDNVYGTPVILEDMKRLGYDDSCTVVSPDVGGVVRARAIAKRLNDTHLAIIDKRRAGPNRSEVMNIIGEVQNRTAIIVDDMVDTAGTLCHAATALREHGASKVVAYCTHPIFSGPAIDNIMASEISEIVVCDSVPLNKAAATCPKIRQLSLAKLISETIYRVNHKESVSSMFED